MGSPLGQLLWPKPGDLTTVFGSPFKHRMIDRREEQVLKDMRGETDKQQVCFAVTVYLQSGCSRGPFHPGLTGMVVLSSKSLALILLALRQAKHRTRSSCSSDVNRYGLAHTPPLGTLWCRP